MFPPYCLSAMLFFGDLQRREDPRDMMCELYALAHSLSPRALWIERHSWLVKLFLRAAELAQGVLDAEFGQAGCDRLTANQKKVQDALRALAGSIMHSWRTRVVTPEAAAGAVESLAALAFPAEVVTRTPEGYAFYALYPESHGLAATALHGTKPVVIGIRSIGLGLGAMVAADTVPQLAFSVRPVGLPFRRELALGDDLAEALGSLRDGTFAIVDEGPGLSGSSFAAVARTLEELGADRARIHFFPSHPGPPGPAADAGIVQRWRAAPRHVVSFEAAVGPDRLADWVEDLTGPPVAPLQDISGGVWRDLAPRRSRPPVDPQRERRKYLLRSAQGNFLLRFAGLGRHGEETLRRARVLADAGLSPPVVGLRHGFLVERWLGEARPLDADFGDRDALIEHVARYLAFRARAFPARNDSGASLVQLGRMLECNAGETFGALPHLASYIDQAVRLETRVRRVETDNRMHLWEWLRLPDGRFVKTDAYDHCAGHDLVGCQDIGWDVIAAGIEFGLDEAELHRLRQRLSARGVPLDGELLAFLEPCYLAFRIGALDFAEAATHDYSDKAILAHSRKSYRMMLETILGT